MTEIQIHIRKACRECYGRGWIANPSWVEYRMKLEVATRELEKIRLLPETPAGGKPLAEEAVESLAAEGIFPPENELEEMNCPYCQGIGWIEEWNPIKDILRNLISDDNEDE